MGDGLPGGGRERDDAVGVVGEPPGAHVRAGRNVPTANFVRKK